MHIFIGFNVDFNFGENLGVGIFGFKFSRDKLQYADL